MKQRQAQICRSKICSYHGNHLASPRLTSKALQAGKIHRNKPKHLLVIVPHNLENNIPRLLNPLLRAHNLNSLALALRAGHLDLRPRALPDAVDFRAAGADDVAVGARVRQDEVADRVLLLGLVEGAVDFGAGGRDGFGRGADEHPGDVAILGRGVQAVGFEGVVVGVGGGVVGDQRHVAACGAAGGGGYGLTGWRALAGVVDADFVVGAEAAEELAVVGDGVVVLERDLDGLAFDFLGELEDVRFGLLDVLGLAGHLDLGAGRAGLALARDVDGHAELLLQLAAALTAATDKEAVLVGLDLEDLGGLGVLLCNQGQDSCRELLDDGARALKADGVTLCLGLGEACETSTGSGVRRTTGLFDERCEVGACCYVLAVFV